VKLQLLLLDLTVCRVYTRPIFSGVFLPKSKFFCQYSHYFVDPVIVTFCKILLLWKYWWIFKRLHC